MSEISNLITATHDTKLVHEEYTGKRNVSIAIRTLRDIRLHSITFKGVKSSYVSGGEIQDISVACNISSYAMTANATYQDITFPLNNYAVAYRTTQTITMQTNRTFELEDGIDSSIDDSALGMGIFFNTITNVPSFEINYYIVGEPYLRTNNINDNYLYLSGFPTDYGDYSGNSNWWIDTDKVINIGYPFMYGFPTDYGDYNFGRIYVKTASGFILCPIYQKTSNGFQPSILKKYDGNRFVL